MTTGPVVETTAGRVSGRRDGRVCSFLGIPYGAATSGAARFQPPGPAPAWTGLRAATGFGPTAPQRWPHPRPGSEDRLTAPLEAYGPGRPPIGEDCLVLNVWTPAIDSEHRPVMFWLHGGGYSTGSASTYDGSRLAARGDVVVVSVNHRLGLLGFLYLDHLSERFAGAGLAGLLDVVAALGWVRDNIERFGGDPSNVTLFGESGGGLKISSLMAMPDAAGLFHKAVIQSGPGLRAIRPERAMEVTDRTLAELQIPPSRLDRLKEIPVEELVAVQSRVVKAKGSPLSMLARGQALNQFGPVIGSERLPAHPFDPAAPEGAANIPLIIGTNKDESTIVLRGLVDWSSLTPAGAVALAREAHADRADDLLSLYHRVCPDATPHELVVSLIMTDAMWIDSVRLAERKAAASAEPVFMYRFDYETNVLDGTLKAAHGLEIPFVFDCPDEWVLAGTRPDRFEMAKLMSAAWVSFGRDGHPGHPGIPDWPPYQPDDRATMVFDLPCRVEIDPRHGLRQELDRTPMGFTP